MTALVERENEQGGDAKSAERESTWTKKISITEGALSVALNGWL